MLLAVRKEVVNAGEVRLDGPSPSSLLLESQPIRELHDEHVLRLGSPQLSDVPAEVERSVGHPVGSALLPHEEDG